MLKKYLVYQLPGYKPEEIRLPNGWVKCTIANHDIIRDLFKRENKRKKVFHKYLEMGLCGVLLHNEQTWMSYGWMSRPSTLGPKHLPAEIRRKNVNWIFSCRTQEIFRGRGLYRLVLQLLIQQVATENGDTSIYIDTERNNLASRRGILAIGSQPKGIISAYRIGIPSVFSWNWGRWDVDAVHPDF